MIAPSTGFSSDMTGYLDIGGRRMRLVNSAPRIVSSGIRFSSPRSEAVIVMITDGRESRLPVYLPHESRRTTTSQLINRSPKQRLQSINLPDSSKHLYP